MRLTHPTSHLGPWLCDLDLGLSFLPVVSVEVSKRILHQGSKHKDITDPEIHIQGLDSRSPWQGGSGTDHECGHRQHSGDAWWEGEPWLEPSRLFPTLSLGPRKRGVPQPSTPTLGSTAQGRQNEV